MSTPGSTRVIIIALLANLGVAVAKLAAATISGSASLLAESAHSLADCGNQLFLLLGKRASAQAPTDAHPLGFGRETFFWSFVVAILLFSGGGLFAMYEGIRKLGEPSPVESPWLAIAVLLISLGLEAFSFRACLKEVRAKIARGGLWSWFRGTAEADLLVVFTEDAAAILGLTIASVCLLLTVITGNPAWDARGSLLIGTLLIVVAALIAIEVKSLLVGEAPAVDYRPMLEELIQVHIEGGRLLRLIALQMGGNEVMLAYKVHPGRVGEVEALVGAINDLEREVRQRFPEVRWQFVEPDDQP